MDSLIEAIHSILRSVKNKDFEQNRLIEDYLVEESSKLASLILKLSSAEITTAEKNRSAILNRIIHNEHLKTFVTCAIDSCFRTKNPKRALNQFLFLARRYNIISSLYWYEKPLYIIGKMFAKLFPQKAFSFAKQFLQHMTQDVIIPADNNNITNHLLKRQSQGVKVNLNRIGEAILGEQEAEKRLSLILLDLQNPLLDVVSVKISSIYSQITPISYEQSLEVLKKKLIILFTACKHFYTLQKKTKFLYLDMEEYKDLHLTVQAFKEILSLPDFFSLSAGIALQSYIPDSFEAQENLTIWAKTRVLQGGGIIKIRIVKGANLGMERVEASLKGWPQAPFKTKAEVDANFKKMLNYGILHAEAVHIAVASHNIFDISYALLLRSMHNLEEKISFEMLEGMCNYITRAVHSICQNTLLYCPTVHQDELHTAMAYLIRRLDENTQKENFLTHIFEIEHEPALFHRPKSRFERSVIECNHLSTTPRRTQDRRIFQENPHSTHFLNEPDTDWSLPQNREFVKQALAKWQQRTFDIPCLIGSGIIFTKQRAQGIDPSRPGFSLLSYSLADIDNVDSAIQYAQSNGSSWNKLPTTDKAQIFRRFAQLLRKTRGEMICAIVAEAGKPFAEADGEVSEAIDFANYYANVIEQHEEFFRLIPKKKSIALVATPWNFPCSIPTSSIIAPLAAGQSVIFKPAEYAALVGFKLTELFYQAGIPHEALQFITCRDEPVGSYLVKHPAINLIMTTGATDTCRLFMKLKPDVRLFGETGGKNCGIVTALADRDLAVKEIVQSAFGYSGQKCSAMSLIILDEEVYQDRKFLYQLVDATASLPCGSAWDFDTKINPLIRPPSDKLKRALMTLEDGEEWLLKPSIQKHNPQLITPGIKRGVQRGSFTHQTEFFGPILGIMCAKDLDDAITTANMTSYGLTSGLFSLDSREHSIWKAKIHAGNCYINRTITGAIVKRQPFGGCKASNFGLGMKAGGENYLLQLLDSFAGDFIDNQKYIQYVEHNFKRSLSLLPQREDKGYFVQAVSSYIYWMEHHFSKTLEQDKVFGEDNFLNYHPHDHIFFYVQESDSIIDCLLVLAAAKISGCAITVGGKKKGMATIPDARFMHLVQKTAFPRFRTLDSLPEDLMQHFSERASCIDIAKPKPHGRLELLHYVYEVSISSSYHRYGNLLNRDHEERNYLL